MARSRAVRQPGRNGSERPAKAKRHPAPARRGGRRRRKRRWRGRARRNDLSRAFGQSARNRGSNGTRARPESVDINDVVTYPGEFDKYGFPLIRDIASRAPVTRGPWRQAILNPVNVVAERPVGVKPVLVARTGRASDARLIGAALETLEALEICESEIGESLRLEREKLAEFKENARQPHGAFLAGRREHVSCMLAGAARARRRIEGLKAARDAARAAIDSARASRRW